MGLFPASNGYTHILVAVDYVNKWVEAIPTSSVDHNALIRLRRIYNFLLFHANIIQISHNFGSNLYDLLD
mgnify:CR=1 FL=1